MKALLLLVLPKHQKQIQKQKHIEQEVNVAVNSLLPPSQATAVNCYMHICTELLIKK